LTVIRKKDYYVVEINEGFSYIKLQYLDDIKGKFTSLAQKVVSVTALEHQFFITNNQSVSGLLKYDYLAYSAISGSVS